MNVTLNIPSDYEYVIPLSLKFADSLHKFLQEEENTG
jgi:hypothetical protein